MDFITVMEWIGTVAFAVSGAVVAIERELDYYGICFYGNHYRYRRRHHQRRLD